MSVYLATFGKLRYLGLADLGDKPARRGSWVLLRTMRGLEMGLLGGQLSPEQERDYRSACGGGGKDRLRGPEPMLQEVRLVREAGQEEMTAYRQCQEDEDRVLLIGRDILLEHNLAMKLVDVEFMMDRKKLFFYFTAEQRVDFRAYVRDLAREFHTRIEMRQIGVRDEARSVRGIAPCGRPCCCSYWLNQFEPIGIRMVKEQMLALNPSKISGLCGRLMCCMSYEYPVYSELWGQLPNPGSKIKSEDGFYLLDGVDVASESAMVRSPFGRLISVPISQFSEFCEAVQRGEKWGEEPGGKAEQTVSRARPRRSGPERAPLAASKDKVSLSEHLSRREAQNASQAGERGGGKRRRRPKRGGGRGNSRREGA